MVNQSGNYLLRQLSEFMRDPFLFTPARMGCSLASGLAAASIRRDVNNTAVEVFYFINEIYKFMLDGSLLEKKVRLLQLPKIFSRNTILNFKFCLATIVAVDCLVVIVIDFALFKKGVFSKQDPLLRCYVRTISLFHVIVAIEVAALEAYSREGLRLNVQKLSALDSLFQLYQVSRYPLHPL